MPKIGHIKVKAARNAYHVMEHIGNDSYKKIATFYKFADTLPYRNLKWMTTNGQIKYRDFDPPKRKVRWDKGTGVKALPKPEKVKIERKKRTKSELPSKSQGATLAASDKALQRIAKPEKLMIKENDRPYKEVVIDSKTTIRVHPDRVEGAKERYYRWLHKSQEQANTKQRAGNIRPPAKVKEVQSDLIFFH